MLDSLLYILSFVSSSLLVNILCSYYLSRLMYRMFLYHKAANNREVLFYFPPKTYRDISKESLKFSPFIIPPLLNFWMGSLNEFAVYFLVFMLYHFIHKQINSEKKLITESKNLTLGYGAALWYYRNYLSRFLEQNLSMRINKFSKIHGVNLPTKLYILCPCSCKVERYIDSETIDRCGELPSLINDNSGIVGREYNITVYRIEKSQLFRCAIEYAQPLKSLLGFKEIGRISTSDLWEQRQEFCKHLINFLKDSNTQKFCELVEFDDEEENNICDVLLNLDSIQEFLKETVL